MSEINTGGPAFPTPGTTYTSPTNGMTLRDYFAAKAMQGLLESTRTSDGVMICRDSYKLADAMLAARSAT